MNVSDIQLRAYIEKFFATLDSCAQQYLPEYRANLFHLTLLPAKITGYVSTQFGIAIEYEKAEVTSIEIIRGSARVEYLFVKAPPGAKRLMTMFGIDGTNIHIENLTLAESFPFRLNTQGASVSFKDIEFKIGNWKRLVQFAEVFGDRDLENWSLGKAESRAKDEVLAAMVWLERARDRGIPISEYVKKYKAKTVLLLGDYSDEGQVRLDAIKAALISLEYEPVLVKDIPDHPHHDIAQKVVAIGAVSRFIIIDDSSKSGHLREFELCKQNSWVTVLLRADGLDNSFMTDGVSHTSNVIREQTYKTASPIEAISEAVRWAEAKLEELQGKYGDTYPWRKSG